MMPNIVRGRSFKGLTAYLMHDTAKDGIERPETDERVGFTELSNFVGDEAISLAEAAKVMALTVRDAERLKEEAGIQKGGKRAEKPPVWHCSLSWNPGELIDMAEMRNAAREALKAAGLELEKGYQTAIVQHTDTEHQHVHIVVNLVHPITGKQANPWNDRQKLQEWGRGYDKRRNTILAHDREAKYAAIDAARAKGKTSAVFTAEAKGAGGRAANDARPKPRRLNKREAEERKAMDAAARQDADRIKGEFGSRWHVMQTKHEAGYQRRRGEADQFHRDRAAERDAIYGKYQTALDAIWAKKAAPVLTPDRAAWQKINEFLAIRKRNFEANEATLWGRFFNAMKLAPKRAGIMQIAMLAIKGAERRRLFERDQKRTAAKMAPPRPPQAKQAARPVTPSPPRVRAEQVKAMRAAELAQFDQRKAAAAKSMQARHQFERNGEQAEKAAFARDKTAAWEAHQAAHPRDNRAATPSARQPQAANDRPKTTPPEAAEERKGGTP